MNAQSRSTRLLPAALVAACGAFVGLTTPVAPANASTDGAESLPEQIVLTGVIRDFKERTVSGGHPDFERRPSAGFGHYSGNISTTLGADGKPVFVGGGHKISSQARDAAGRPIAAHLANNDFGCTGGGEPILPENPCIVMQDSRGRDAFNVCFESAVFNADGTSTWVYSVEEIAGGQDLSHFVLGLDPSHDVIYANPREFDVVADPNTGIYGVKWDVTDSFSDGTFTVVLDGHYAGAEQDESVVVKGGRISDIDGLFTPSGAISDTGSPFQLAEGDADLGDSEASLGAADSGGIDSPESFDQWFRDVPGVNMSMAMPITLVREQGSNVYVFDDRHDPLFSQLGGFFPVNNQLFGNSPNNNKNFHFTFELATEFIYRRNSGQVFTFRGDDDVFVFIDDQLVIDIGGVHSAVEQTIDLDRLCWLEDGDQYELRFFFAERHRTQSNFRIETTLNLRTAKLPNSAHLYD